jgi:hypothetical protein
MADNEVLPLLRVYLDIGSNHQALPRLPPLLMPGAPPPVPCMAGGFG